MNAIPTQWRPYLVLVGGVAAVSTASLFIRNAQNEGAASLVIAAFRLTLAAVILTPFALSRHWPALRGLSRRDLALGIASGVLLGVHFATWITSLEYTSVISSVVLVTTSPLWVALAAPFVLHERLGRATAMAILLGMGGSIIVTLAGNAGTAPNQTAPLVGNMLALAGAFAIAGCLLIGRGLRARLATVPYIWLSYSTAAVVLAALVIVSGKPVLGLPPQAYVWMTLLALIPQLIGHSAYNYALGYLSAAYVSLTALGEPIGSTILAALFLGERPLPLQLLGGALIMGALLLASREELRKKKKR